MKSLLKHREVWLLAAIVVLIGGDLDALRRLSPTPAICATVFNDTSILIILALGQMVVILTRSIDLSIAANLCSHRHGGGDAERRASRRSRSRC